MCDCAAEQIVDQALAEGRIPVGRRSEWLRKFEVAPEEAGELLLRQEPDVGQASRNYWADPANEEAYQRFEATFGEVAA